MKVNQKVRKLGVVAGLSGAILMATCGAVKAEGPCYAEKDCGTWNNCPFFGLNDELIDPNPWTDMMPGEELGADEEEAEFPIIDADGNPELDEFGAPKKKKRKRRKPTKCTRVSAAYAVNRDDRTGDWRNPTTADDECGQQFQLGSYGLCSVYVGDCGGSRAEPAGEECDQFQDDDPLPPEDEN